MKPKRILHIIGRMDRAGAETMLMNLFRTIDKKLYIFDFLYFTNDICDFDEEIRMLGGHIYRISETNIIKRTFSLFTFLKNKKDFHAVHTHTLFNNGINLLIAYLTNHQRRIAHSHNTSDTGNTSLQGNVYQFISKKLINKLATKKVACGLEAANFLFYDTADVIQLPNAIDITYFNNCRAKNKNYIKKELELNNNCIVISQIGRLLKVKNHEFSINLAKELSNNNINFHMVFAGDGKLKTYLLGLCEANNLLDKITFLGVRNDIPKILAGSDLMIMPSLYEGFPVVLVESQAANIPTIVSNNVSNEVDLGINRIFFKPLDKIESWVETIINIKTLKQLNNKELINTLSSQGYNINTSINILNRIYQ